MSGVIPFDYQGQAVRFSSEGWINATDVAAQHGKRLDHWLANAETQQYMAALSEILNTRNSGDLIQARRGRNGGTWLHPKLAVVFARWLDVKFAVWCDMRIDALLHGDMTLRQKFDHACKVLEDRRDIASLSARELSSWRWQKSGLEYEASLWREKLQLTLNLQ